MKPRFHIFGVNISAGARRWMEQSLGRLHDLITISATAVVLEHRRDGAPPVRAYVSLAVPGPDIHAEARDHTLEAAWLKVTSALRRQIELRKSQQVTRVKRNGHVRVQPIRRTSRAVGSGARISSHCR